MHHWWFHSHFPPFFPVLHCPRGLGELQACPFPDVVFPPLLLSTLPSSPFRCALQDGFGQTWWTEDMTIPLQCASFYDDQVFVWSDRLLDLGTDFLVGNIVFVWGALCLAINLIFIACILPCSSAMRVDDSQACSKMDVTREHISRIFELREMLCRSQLVSTLLMLLSSVLSWRISQAWNLVSQSLIAEPRYLKIMTV